MGYSWNDPTPHDGKQGRCGCGQGYSWNDDNDFRGRRNYSGGGGGCGSGVWLIILVIVASVVGAFNELLGALIVIIGGFILAMNH